MLNVWIISDGKPGHLNQSLGLVEALQRLRPGRVSIHQLAPLTPWRALLTGLTARRPSTSAGVPDLIIGAGHRTHLSLLALGRAHGAKTVVLMRPSLPLSWFDLALIPEHDQPAPRANVVATVGALNRMQPAAQQRPGSGMLLIGGPSKHFIWDEAAVLAQVAALVKSSPRGWLLTTSRRTPDSFLPALADLQLTDLDVVPFDQTDAQWLVTHLPAQEVCWVTNDSVSMVYEALSAGCRVGVIELQQQTQNRVVAGMQQLIRRGQVMTPNASHADLPAASGEPFNEAQRCAQRVLRLFER